MPPRSLDSSRRHKQLGTRCNKILTHLPILRYQLGAIYGLLISIHIYNIPTAPVHHKAYQLKGNSTGIVL